MCDRAGGCSIPYGTTLINLYIERARAIEAAHTATTKAPQDGRGQLHGLPLLIKDITPVAGLPFVRGCVYLPLWKGVDSLFFVFFLVGDAHTCRPTAYTYPSQLQSL